jgi:inosine triphosphate pyrophosphatase
MNGKRILKFVSSNKNKLVEMQQIFEISLPTVEIQSISNIDLPELQGKPEEIAREKLKLALLQEKGPLIIEDTSLCYNALGGLPGPYIQDFLINIKPEGLHKLLHGFEDKSGYAQRIIGLGFQQNKEIFVGRTSGMIVKPRGSKDFGWDPIFQPDGFDQTYAELQKEVKNKISHRYRAVAQLIEYLKENDHIFESTNI